jgi:hypothetical protein
MSSELFGRGRGRPEDAARDGRFRPTDTLGDKVDRATIDLVPRAVLLHVACLVSLLSGLPSTLADPAEPGPLLPDLIVDRETLFDWVIEVDPVTERRQLRFSTATPNIGLGPLILVGADEANSDGTLPVHQKIFLPNGGAIWQPAGDFSFHEEHSHIHLEDWASYRVRAVERDGTPGAVVANSAKTSFCVADFAPYAPQLPGFRPIPTFSLCESGTQGISVGWSDIYSRTVDGQSIDIEDLAEGIYWLENEVDPEDHILESSELNNTARILIVLGGGDPHAPDGYEPNDSGLEVVGRGEGAPRSPNLGPTGDDLVIDELGIHDPEDVDIFRFYSPGTGMPGDRVRIDFLDGAGDVDLALLDAEGELLAMSATRNDFEEISLEGLPAGNYFARISTASLQVQPRYQLSIRPARSEPPLLRIDHPGRSEIVHPHALVIFDVRWTVNDPDGNRTWVTIWVHQQPRRDGEERLLPSSWRTRGEIGHYSLNSAELEPGTYWIYCEATDGTSTSGVWSTAPVTFVSFDEACVTPHARRRDCNENGIDDVCEIALTTARDCNRNDIPDTCDLAKGTLVDRDGDGTPDSCAVPFHRGDVNSDGSLDVSDTVALLSWLFSGARTPPCLEAADFNNDHSLDLADPVSGLNYLFRGGPPPAPPGPPDEPCGADPDDARLARTFDCAAYPVCADSR